MSALRLAVLIGVRDYPRFGYLETPYQDVACLRECLRPLGFEIIERAQNTREPKSKKVIVQAIEEARTRLAAQPSNGQGHPPSVLFYFAGHGLSFGGCNYLLAEEFDPADTTALSCEALEVEREVAAALSVRSDVQSIILIDACRNEFRGARVMGEPFVPPNFIPGRSVFGFATSPGQLAIDGSREGQSPYSKALATFLPVRGVPINACLSAVTDAVLNETGGQQRPMYIDFGVRLSIGGELEHLPVLTGPPTEALGGSPPRPRRAYTDAEVAAVGHQIHKLKAKDTTGRWAYYFVLVEPEFEAAFLTSLNGPGTIDLEDFGVVVASCYSEKPTREVCDYLRQRYGFSVDPEGLPSASGGGASDAQTPVLSKPAPTALMVALRQHMGLGQWRHLVMLVPPDQRMPFAHAADELAALDGSGLGRDGRGLFGGLRKALDTVGASLFDIESLSAFGEVIHRGDGQDIPRSVLARISRDYGVIFDWSDWDVNNGVTAEARRPLFGALSHRGRK